MSSVEETARLLLQADQKGFVGAKASIAGLKVQLEQLTASYNVGKTALPNYLEEGRKIQNQLDLQTSALKAAEDALKNYGSAQTAAAVLAEQSRGKMTEFGQAMLKVGQIAQDSQSDGLRGILNNSKGLAPALGSDSGFAGAVTILGAAFEAFKPQILVFLESLKTGDVRKFRGEFQRPDQAQQKPDALMIQEAFDSSESDPSEAESRLVPAIRDQAPSFGMVEEELQQDGYVKKSFDRHAGPEDVDPSSDLQVTPESSNNGLKNAQEERKLPRMATPGQEGEANETGLTEDFDRQVYLRSAPMTGDQFTEDPARDVTQQATDLQTQGLDVNRATLMAMNQAMAKLANQAQGQASWARQMGGIFGQVVNQTDQMQPTALNFGSGGG